MNIITAPASLLLITPLLGAFLSLTTSQTRVLHGVNLSTMTGLVVSEIALIQHVLTQGPLITLWNQVYIDSLSTFILFIVTFIGLSCSLYMWAYLDSYLEQDLIEPRRLKQFYFLFHIFLFAMIVATIANSLGVVWVAIEGTTLATLFLITFFQSREGLEAGWKYLILCSVGIALALFGTVLTYFSSVPVFGSGGTGMNITDLLGVAEQLDPHILKIAFIFILVGYGTKIGLAPMHAWVPDAYAHAPAPVTAMLAGVLETVAVYAVLRSKSIMDHALPQNFTGNLLIFFGIFSFAIAALFLLIQRDYKRLFAWSSVEHMGIAMVGFGVGGALGMFGGLFHLLNHALAKSLAFFAAGNIRLRFATREIDAVQGLVNVQPGTAVGLVVAGLALVGMPPFSTFISEAMILSALATQSFTSPQINMGHFVTLIVSDEVRSIAIVLFFLLIAVVLFGGVMYRISMMLFGISQDGVRRGEPWNMGHVPMVLTAVVLLVLGFVLPEPVKGLMDQAVSILTMG